MSTLTLYPEEEKLPHGERIVFNLYVISALGLFMFLMLLGLAMRFTEAGWASVSAPLFYQLLTMHGAGMVGTVGLASTSVMWFFLRKYVKLHLWAFLANYVLFIVGALVVLASVFIGGYAGMWTFLYPLPVHSMGLWTPGAAMLFMVGYLLIGVGLLLFYLDAAAGILSRFGNFSRALGLQWLFGGEIDQAHPKAVVASTMVIIANSLGILAGAVVLVMCLINAFYPSLVLDALLAKNLIYWFGHMFINATIYMAVIAVYELLPRYSGRAYPVSRPFLWAWAVSCVFVIVVFPHHLLMDYAEPRWLAVIGQIVSYGAGFPVFLVTAYGVLANIYRSKMRWKMPARLAVLSVYGWAAGIVPAIADGTIRVNEVMHNTQWVPGHFHFYLILGVLPMILALLYHVVGSRTARAEEPATDRVGFPLYVAGALLFTLTFLAAGHASVPRRYAVHIPEWQSYDQIGSVGAALIVAAMLFFVIRITIGLLKASGSGRAANTAR